MADQLERGSTVHFYSSNLVSSWFHVVFKTLYVSTLPNYLFSRKYTFSILDFLSAVPSVTLVFSLSILLDFPTFFFGRVLRDS